VLASQSLSISRSTGGTGDSAPAPVSSPGWSCTAQASWWRLPAWAAAVFTAAVTASADTAGSSVVTPSITISTGSRPPSNPVPGPHLLH
jgi:hypothetical protein